jgi:hypothetical protein
MFTPLSRVFKCGEEKEKYKRREEYASKSLFFKPVNVRLDLRAYRKMPGEVYVWDPCLRMAFLVRYF